MVCLLSVDCPRCSASSLPTLGNASSARTDYHVVTLPQRPSAKKRGPRVTGCLLFLGLVFGLQLASPFGAVTLSTPINDAAASLMMALPATASPADRESAFAVLTANIAHYRSIFEQGQATLGQAQYANDEKGPVAREDPPSAAVRFRDYCKNVNPELDMSFLAAFRRADKHFTADNEPQALRDWVDDMSFMHDDLSRWVHVAVDYQISTISSRADLEAAAETVRQDLVKAEADASAVQRG
jgi:hypothetical protein